jgi:HAD superfamily hydrolase (TIGR01509 family)
MKLSFCQTSKLVARPFGSPIPAKAVPFSKQGKRQQSRRVQLSAAATDEEAIAEDLISKRKMALNPQKDIPDLPNLKAVLFDVDGTLTDSDPLHFKAFQDILVKFKYNGGEPITREFFDEHISGGHNILLGKFLWPDWTQEQRDAFADEKEALFREYSQSILKRVPGLTEWMDWIDCRGLKKAAVTNAPAENARVMLLALGMDKWFDEIILGENCKMPKPHPDPYLDAIKILGVNRDEALICEDSPSGTAAGIAADIPVVGVLTSQTTKRMHEAGVFVAVNDYHELLDLVKKHVPYDEECDVKFK